jgi:hypothetical protein
MNARRTTIAMGLVTVGMLLSSHGAGAMTGGGDATCHVEANNPHGSKGSPGWIVGKGRISCTAAIDSLEIFAQLEQNVGGRWDVVGVPGRNPVNAPKANEKYTTQGQVVVRGGCVPDRSAGRRRIWRTALEVDGMAVFGNGHRSLWLSREHGDERVRQLGGARCRVVRSCG